MNAHKLAQWLASAVISGHRAFARNRLFASLAVTYRFIEIQRCSEAIDELLEIARKEKSRCACLVAALGLRSINLFLTLILLMWRIG